MSAERTVSIYYAADNRKNYISLDVPVNKLVNYSEHARSRYLASPKVNRPFPEGEKRKTTRTEYELGHNMNEDFARTIAIHIKKSDPTDPAPLTLDLFGEDLSIADLAQLWRVIDWGYWFDKGLFQTAMDRVTFLHIKGYLDDDTRVEIEKYCKERKGWWDSLLDRVEKNQDDIEKAAKQKEAREKRQAEQKAAAERKVKAEHRAREEEKTKAGKQRGNGKNGASKGKGKKSVAPFEQKDDDFPSLS